MNDPMSPAASPGSPLRSGSGVRRVNNLPLWIILGGVMVFLITMALVASNRASQQLQPPAPAAGTGGDASIHARQVAGIGEEGIVTAREAPRLELPVEPPIAPAAAPRPGGAPRAPVAPAPVTPSPYEEEMARLRQGRLQQLAQGAKARTSVPVPLEKSTREAPGGRGGVTMGAPALPPDMDPRAAYQARVAQLQGGGVGASGAGSLGGSNAFAAFGNAGGGDRWALASRPEPPRTRYELRAGFVIPALLMSGINSDLPGQIMAQVSENVFDTPTGKYVLIPQGSRLVGTYSSEVKYGQARVLIAWQRIVFPDGAAMDIGAMPGADGSGYAGFSDKVNNHYVRLFGSAILLSAVTAGIAYSQDQGQQGGNGYNNRPTFGSAMSEALGQQFGQVTGQLLSKNLNISPTLEIRPGYRFNVMVTKDLTFDKPYQSNVR